jgi:hypothetical protein
VIERTLVNGRKATVAYIKKDFTPATAETAEMAEVEFENGDRVFLVMEEPKPEKENHIAERRKG